MSYIAAIPVSISVKQNSHKVQGLLCQHIKTNSYFKSLLTLSKMVTIFKKICVMLADRKEWQPEE